MAAALPGYTIGAKLGAGAGGLVLAGRHRRLNRPVAVKVLPGGSEYAPGRFETEARLLAGMDHPHIVRVFDYVEADDLLLIVMELLDGGTLTRRRATLDPRGACAVGLAVAAGLSHAHVRGVLHLDIKPGNLLFDAAGTLKVADFGIAKMFEGTAVTATAVAGTPSYMAPEQITGGRLSPATDLYALGVVLYQLLTGAPPFDPNLPIRTLFQQHLTAAPPPLTDVPAPIAQVVLRALAKDPADRQPTAQAFALDLAMAATAAHGTGWSTRVWLPLHLDDPVGDAADQPSEPVTLPSPPPLDPRPSSPRPSSPRIGAPPFNAPSPRPFPRHTPGAGGQPGSRRRRGWRIAVALAVTVAVAVPTALVVLLIRPDPELTAGPTLLATLPVPAAAAHPGAFSPDGRLFVATTNSTVTLWNVADPVNAIGVAALRDVARSVGPVAAFSPDGRTLAHSGVRTDGRQAVFLWDVTRPQSPTRIDTIAFFGDAGDIIGVPIEKIAFSADGSRVVAVGGLHQMSWDLVRRTRLPVDSFFYRSGIHEFVVGLSSDARNIVTADYEGTVWVWDIQDAEHVVNTATVPAGAAGSPSVLFLDDDALAITDEAGTTCWDATDRDHPAPITLPDGGIGPADQVLLSFDRHTLVVVTKSRREIRRWDVTDPLHPHRTATFRFDLGSVSPRAMTLSADGRIFSVSDSWKEAVLLWRLG